MFRQFFLGIPDELLEAASIDGCGPVRTFVGEEKRSVQLAIQTFFGFKPINYGSIMASLTISAVPMLIMFIFLQKYYVEGIASTGIKG